MRDQFVFTARVTLLASMLASGCTWVKPTAGASQVTLVKPEHVNHCKSLGSTVANVADKVGIITRGDEKVALELLTIAKNSAVNMGGDTLVAESEVAGGAQKFRIYKCQ